MSPPDRPQLPFPGARAVGKTRPVEVRTSLPEAIEGKRAGQGRIKGKFAKKGTGVGAPGILHQHVVGYWLRTRFGPENVAAQVRIRPRTATGSLRSQALIVDYVVRDPVSGALSYWDAKTTTQASRYSQDLGYADLQRFGGEVRSSKNLPGWLSQGADVAPGTVTKVHESVHEIGRIKAGIRGTAARGTDTLDTDTSRATSPASRGTSSPDVSTSSPDVPTSSPGVPTSTQADLSDVEVRTKAGRFAEKVGKLKKLRLGFGADLLIQIATQLMLGILEAKLSKVNTEGIARDYKDKIYKPLLKKIVDETVAQVRAGIFAPAADSVSFGLSRQWIYVNYQYDVVMERQATDTSDAIISIVRGFDFVEVYHSLEPVGTPAALGEPQPLAKVMHHDKREPAGVDLFRYRCRHQLLVWDPPAAAVFEELRQERLDLLVLFDRTMQNVVHRSDASRWVPDYSPDLEALVAGYQFRAAHTLLVEGALGKHRYPKIPAEHRDALTPLIDALSKADRLLRVPGAWAEDRRTALSMYLDADPFRLRARLIREEEEWRRRAQREAESRTRRGREESAASSDVVDRESGRALQRHMQ